MRPSDKAMAAYKRRKVVPNIYIGDLRAGLQQSAHRHGEGVAPEALYPPGSPQYKAQGPMLPRRAPRRGPPQWYQPNRGIGTDMPGLVKAKVRTKRPGRSI